MKKNFIFGLAFLFMAMHSRAEIFFDAPNSDGVTIYYRTMDGEGNKAMVASNHQLCGVVNIPDSVIFEGVKFSIEAIAPYAFYNNVELIEVSFGSNITTIMERAFEHCKSLKNVKWGNVTTIKERAFEGCESLAYIKLGDKVTTIENGAFANCGLKNVILPEGLKEINDGVFADNKNLVEITMPASVTKIGEVSFANCGFTTFTVPDSVTSIGAFAFSYCKNLTTLSFGENLSAIGEDIVYQSFELKEFTVSEKNKTYATIDGVLVNHDKNELLIYPYAQSSIYIIPNSIKTIGRKAFSELNITDIIMGSNVDSIGPRAFSFTKLKSIDLPEKLSYLADSIFLHCQGLDSITIPNGVRAIGNDAFNYCRNLNNITIGKEVTTICDRVFANCDSLKKVVIPDKVVSIGLMCFFYCDKVKELTIGKNVTNIGSRAFGIMTSLLAVYNRNPIPQYGDDLFFGLMTYKTRLYVPVGSGDAYKAAAIWENFLVEETEVSNETVKKEHIIIENTIGGIIISSNTPVNIYVYTVEGRLVHQTLLSNAQLVSLPSGIYIVTSNEETKKVFVQ